MIVFKQATENNFTPASLDAFERTQEIRNVYRLIGGVPVLSYAPFTDDWSAERKREKAAAILSGNHITYCAFEGERVIGFIMLDPRLDNGRLIIESFHVAGPFRHKGIGRKLFEKAVAEARRRGAVSVYASASSAEETVKFYTAMGFVPSPSPMRAYAEEEPRDIQMECSLQSRMRRQKI